MSQNSRREFTAASGKVYTIRSPLAGHLMIEALGPGAIEMVEVAGSAKMKLKAASDMFAAWDNMKKILAVGMVSPKFGQESTDDGSVISWLDMGDDGPEVYSAILEHDVAKAADFPAPSAVQEG